MEGEWLLSNPVKCRLCGQAAVWGKLRPDGYTVYVCLNHARNVEWRNVMYRRLTNGG